MKLFAVQWGIKKDKTKREDKRKKRSNDDAKIPQLWILTPTASANY